MKCAGNSVLETRQLKIGYKRKIVAEELNLDLKEGQFICLLGPNGCGKSTLIKTLSGITSPISGQIYLYGDDLLELPSLEIAHRLSLVLTDRVEAEISVYEVVALGRAPYTDWKGRLSDDDREKIKCAIQMTGTEPFIHQKITELSDGERQKVMIARALAQDTGVIILDEPTAHLDLPNRLEIFRLLKTLAHETGKAILLSTHELDLALQAADHIWILDSTGAFNTGVPEDLVMSGTFESAFKRDGLAFDITSGAFQFHKRGSHPIHVKGDGTIGFWTRKSLERTGFYVDSRPDSLICVEIIEDVHGTHHWISIIEDVHQTHHSIESLLYALTHFIEKNTEQTHHTFENAIQ